MEYNPQDCPLCNTAAEYYRVDYGNRKYFRCPTCTYFQISDRAEKLILDAPQKWRDSIMNKAINTPEEHLLVIIVPSSPEQTDSTKIKVTCDYELKTDLSL